MDEFATGRLRLYPTPQTWDTTVVHIKSKDAESKDAESEHTWWWNAWRASTLTELSGYAETEQAARAEMADAIREAGEPESGPGS